MANWLLETAFLDVLSFNITLHRGLALKYCEALCSTCCMSTSHALLFKMCFETISSLLNPMLC